MAETEQMLLLIIVAVGSVLAVVAGGFLAMTATLAAMSDPFSLES